MKREELLEASDELIFCETKNDFDKWQERWLETFRKEEGS